MKIGFIGQGFIGKNMADDYERRGYDVVRYALEAPYQGNKDKIAGCDVVFVAVPTPTTPDGFDASLIESVLSLVGKDHTVVIKSTILPGTTERLQTQNPGIFVLHSPEFLREVSAARDTAEPERNIIGMPEDTPEYRTRAQAVLETLPDAPFTLITTARNAECIKYIGNTFLTVKLLFMDISYEFAKSNGADWETVRGAVVHDSRIGESHTNVLHPSGRGAGGHCFIKDFEALLRSYQELADDPAGLAVLTALRAKNNQLLLDSKKDLDLLHGVYGDNVPLMLQ